MQKSNSDNIFLKSILPALITGLLGLLGGLWAGNTTKNSNSANVDISGNDVKNVKAIKADQSTIVEKGDYYENDYDTSKYKLVKFQNDTITLILKKKK